MIFTFQIIDPNSNVYPYTPKLKEGTRLHELLIDYKCYYESVTHVEDKFFWAHEDPNLGYCVVEGVFEHLSKYDQVLFHQIMASSTELGKEIIKRYRHHGEMTYMGKEISVTNGEVQFRLMFQLDGDAEKAGFYK
jgi:hypothetical protein